MDYSRFSVDELKREKATMVSLARGVKSANVAREIIRGIIIVENQIKIKS